MKGIEGFILKNREHISIGLENILNENEIIGSKTWEAIRYMVFPAGHLWRPMLGLLTYTAVQPGREPSYSIKAVSAVELLHIASLIFDDIHDNSDMRRNKPSCHIKYGQGIAQLAGIDLIILAMKLLNNTEPQGNTLVNLATDAVNNMIYGQELDILQIPSDQTSLLEMHGLKNALYPLAGAIGGIIGGADAITMNYLIKYCKKIAGAYQTQDDLNDMFASPTETGKHSGEDVGKFTAANLEKGVAQGLIRKNIADAETYARQIKPDGEILAEFAKYVISKKQLK